MSNPEIVVQAPYPWDEEHFVNLWLVDSPRCDCLTSVWGSVTAKHLPISGQPNHHQVVVRAHGLIVAFLHCDRLTQVDPIHEMWGGPDDPGAALEAAELAYSDR